MNHPVFIISGVPGCGKSTISKELVKRFDFGFVIPIETIRELVISGYSGPLPEWTEETTRQFDLSFTATANLCNLYNKNGFTIAIEQVLYPRDVEEKIVSQIRNKNIIKIFLNPKLETILDRNKKRNTKDFDTSMLIEPIKAMHPIMEKEFISKSDWNIIDSSHQTLSETVDEIIKLVK